MRAHVIGASGVILNTIEVASLDWMPDYGFDLLDASVGGSIGDSIVGGVVVPAGVNPAVIAAQAAADLADIDLKSIRGLREWVSQQVNAPKTLTDLERRAVDTRKKLR